MFIKLLKQTDMVIVDLLCIPDGASFNDWYELYKEGIVVFDSSRGGIKPFIIDEDKVSLVDFQSMDEEEMNKFGEAFNNIVRRRQEEFIEGTSIMRKNTEELIKYLKKINDEVEGKTDAHENE